MSRINLNKYKDAIDGAWKEVTNPQSKNDWAVFGYDGKTYDLKVVGTGEDGFEEMVDEFSGGKIMYAVCRVNDPNTNLPKIVFVNWQGEGVPANVKGVCANHLRDVTNIFRGCHVTINARSEDDLDYDTLLERVKKSSGSNYSVHKEKPKPMEKIKPVGAVYKRINPIAEIDINKRDSFWSKQEQEEQKRVTEEKEKVTIQRAEGEKKRKEREAREENVRDEVIRERSKSIEQQRAMQKTHDKNRQEEEKMRYQATLQDKEKDDQEFRKRSDSERRRRLQEAQNLIGSRQQSIDEERKKFTAGPEHKKPPPPTAPKKKLQTRFEPPKKEEVTSHEPVVEAVQPSQQQQQQVIDSGSTVEEEQQETVASQDAEDLYETVEDTPAQPSYHEDEQIKDEAQPPLQPAQETAPTEQEDFYDTVADSVTEPNEQPSSDLYETIPEANAPQATATTGLVARAIYDYQAEGEDEITFDPGDIITEIEELDDGWWRGRASNGAYGMFPANYVELIDGNQTEVEHTATEDQPAEDVSGAQGLKARAIYDYQASDDTEITFDPDDVIYEIEQIDDGWWRGTGPDGRNGLFPANYVELI